MRRAPLLLTLLAACGARTELVTPLDADAPDAPDAPDAATAPDVASPPPRCGNGVLDEGEACDLGALNRLVPAFQYSQPGVAPTPLRPVVRRGSVAGFYGYRSASAHTGFELAGTANVVVYADALGGALGLALFAGVDDAAQPAGDLRASLTGVPLGAVLAVSDDANEFTRDASGTFTGRWTFDNNTDGGAISNLPWEVPWRIAARIEYRQGVTAARVVDGASGPAPLSTRAEVVLEHFAIATACRPDCREPRCGDGYLDAGERCDDGNRADGDGCGADCLRLE